MNEQPLPTLLTCLQSSPWRRLLAMMAAYQLPCSTRWSKEALVQALHQHLSQPVVVEQMITQLSASAQQLLRALLQSAGQLPLHTLQQQFGELPLPYSGRPRLTPSAEAGTSTERHNGAMQPAPVNSPAERLWQCGLLYVDPAPAAFRYEQRAVLPRELLPIIATQLAAPRASSHLPAAVRPGRPPDLLWHLGVWLATIAAEPIKLVRGGWLPPTVLTNLLGRLGLVESRAAAEAAFLHSERSQRYLAFLHYLAEAAGWVNPIATPSLADAVGANGNKASESLFLTPSAWPWLAASPAERWQQLWQAWAQAPRGLDQRYHFAWAGLTLEARRVVHGQLARLPVNQWQPVAQWIEQVRLHDVHYQLFSRLEPDLYGLDEGAARQPADDANNAVRIIMN